MCLRSACLCKNKVSEASLKVEGGGMSVLLHSIKSTSESTVFGRAVMLVMHNCYTC